MLLAIVGIICLFFLAFMVPFMSFLLPVFKIKKMNDLSGKKRVIVNLIVMGIISVFDLRLLPFYIGVFLVMETIYYYFNIVNEDVEMFDRVIISTTVITAITISLTLLLVGNVQEMLEVNKDVYMKLTNVDKSQIDEVFEIARKNSIFIVFVYSLICNYLMYFILEAKSYRTWKLSYKWILLYIGAFFLITVLNIENFYVENLFNISKLIYVLFGVKVIYTMIRGKASKFKGAVKMLAILTAITFPKAVFVLGAINSFNIKIAIQKK